MRKVNCAECGKQFEVIESDNITIPKFRCDECIESLR